MCLTEHNGAVHFQVRRLNLLAREILIDEFLDLNGPQKGAVSGGNPTMAEMCLASRGRFTVASARILVAVLGQVIEHHFHR